MRGLRRTDIISFLLATLALGVALRLQGGRLETYRSPEVSVGKADYRFELRIPHGWVAEAPKNLGWDRTAKLVAISPPERWKWAPGWLRNLLFGPDDPTAEIDVALSTLSEREKELAPTGVDDTEMLPSDFHHGAARFLITPGGSFTVSYRRSDQKQFEATYQEVLRSFHFVH